MATDTAPTLNSLAREGLRKANIAKPSNDQIKRAKEEWVPEVKNDIWALSKKLKSLQKTVVQITTEGAEVYSNPSDYSSFLSATVLDGLDVGVATGGASGTITLAADETITEAALKQKRGILIYEGTAKGEYVQVTAYNTTTKVATVEPDFDTAPVNTDKYMFVDTVIPLYEKPIWDLDKETKVNGSGTGLPVYLFPRGDSDNGEYVLWPKPYRTSGVPYGIRLRYYCDLKRVDLASTLMATLYRRWRNVFVEGVRLKQFQTKSDERESMQKRVYNEHLKLLIARETYGTDMSDLQQTLAE